MQNKNSFITLFVRTHTVICTLFITMCLIGCGYTFYQMTENLTRNDEAGAVAFLIISIIIVTVSILVAKWCKVANGAIQYAAYMWPICPRFDLLVKSAKSGEVDGCRFFTSVFSFKYPRIALLAIAAIVGYLILEHQAEGLITFVFLGFEIIVLISLGIVGKLCANWSEA